LSYFDVNETKINRTNFQIGFGILFTNFVLFAFFVSYLQTANPICTNNLKSSTCVDTALFYSKPLIAKETYGTNKRKIANICDATF